MATFGLDDGTNGERSFPFMHLSKTFEALSLGQRNITGGTLSHMRNKNYKSIAGEASYAENCATPTPVPSQDLVTKYENEILPLLQAVFPKRCIKRGTADIDHMSKNHMQLMIYAITNNLAGLGCDVPPKMIYDYLKGPLTSLLRSNAGISSGLGLCIDAPSVQSMMEVYFRCAVEEGDARAVEYLLRNPDVKIEANQQSITVEGVKYTVIERSASLQHFEITRLLLEFGADPNKSFRECKSNLPLSRVECLTRLQFEVSRPTGAMDYAIASHVPGSCTGYSLVKCLLEHGSTVTRDALRKIVQEKDVSMMEVLLEHGLDRHWTVWAENRFLCAVATEFNANKLHALIKRLQSLETDFSKPISSARLPMRNYWDEIDWPPMMIDLMACRGDLSLVMQLRSYGAPVTDDVTVAAVKSSNLDLVQYLLEQGACVHRFSPHFYTSPFAEAIRMQATDMVQLMYSYVLNEQIEDGRSQSALLAAFAEIGDVSTVQYMISALESHDLKSLGYAMLRAVAANQAVVAVVLLEAGASTHMPQICQVFGSLTVYGDVPHGMSPLVTALKNRNVCLAKRLLEHDCSLSGALEPAAKWGNLDILDDLIFAGAIDEEYGHNVLATAVRYSSIQCVKRLCQAGMSMASTAILAAVELDAAPMVKLLLHFNNDVLEPETLNIAMDTSPEMFQLILRYCRRRRPTGICGWGRSALCRAIDRGHEDIIQALLDAGAVLLDVSDEWSGFDRMEHPLAVAIKSTLGNNINLVRMILDSGIPIDSVIEDGEVMRLGVESRQTALMVAITMGSTAMVQLLLDYGADVNIPASRGTKRTSLQIAAELGYFKLVQLLLDAGADINAAPAQRSGLTTFQAAAKGGFLGVAEQLVEHGADPMAPGSPVDGRCAIRAAAEHGRTDMVSYLLQSGVWPIAKLKSAKSFAAQGGYSAASRLLQHAINESLLQDQNDSSLVSVRQLDIVGPNRGLAPHQIQEMLGEAHGDDYSITVQAAPELAVGDVSSFPDQLAHGEMDLDPHPDADIPPGQDRHTCHICSPPLSLSNASALRRHERSRHKDIFPAATFDCDICFKRFDRKDTFGRHKATHDKREFDACPACDKKFRNDYLKRHALACKAGA